LRTPEPGTARSLLRFASTIINIIVVGWMNHKTMVKIRDKWWVDCAGLRADLADAGRQVGVICPTLAPGLEACSISIIVVHFDYLPSGLEA
jgi:hypothetical protein